MDRKEQAKMLSDHGFNCCQAVACSFCNVMGEDPIHVFKMAEAFGHGMGTMVTCGAVSAMAMVAGMKLSDANLDHPRSRGNCYTMMQLMIGEFLEKNGSIVCRELKGVDTGKPLRSCEGCIEDAVEILDRCLLGIE